MTNTIYTTPTQIIEKRKSVIADIKDYWQLITTNNVLAKNETPKYDVLKIYAEVTKKEEELVKLKVAIQAINMGLKSIKELPEDSSYASIFLLSQLKERLIKLERVPTRKAEDEKVAITKAFVTEEVSKVEKEISTIEAELKIYNDTIKFEL